jgi:hypothetical protein
MPQYSMQQVEALWTANGGDPGWAPLMAGLAWAESNWNSDIRAQTASDDSVGLWQINYIGNLLTDRTAKYGSPEQLRSDPNLQAKAAIDIWGDSGGNRAWQGADAQGNPAQRIWTAWRDAGFPQKPSESVVSSWIAAKGGDPTAVGNASTTSPITSPRPGGSVTETGCNNGSKGFSFNGINIPGVSGKPGEFSGLGSACQLKAVSGGLMIGLGGALLVTGVIVVVAGIAAGTKAGKAAAGVVGTVVGGPAGGAAASSAVGKAGTASKKVAGRTQSAGVSSLLDGITDSEADALERSAKEQSRQRRENPSAKQKEFETNRRAAKRASSSRFDLQPGETAF